MPDTFQTLAVLAVALLPGALYVWAFERQVGRWGVTMADRAFRFVGWSAIFQAAVAPFTYWFWSTQWPMVHAGATLSWWLWPAALAYVIVPMAIGTKAGRGARASARWARWFAGPNPAPRAWDHVFTGEKFGWVKLRLKSGIWLGGTFAGSRDGLSYAAGYPESQDLYLSSIVATDPETGEFQRNEDGSARFLEGGLLVRWDEVEYLQFTEKPGE